MSRSLNRLLADVLELQVDLDDPSAIEARASAWAELVSRGEPLPADDVELLWRSPQARAQLAEIRAEFARSAMVNWRAKGFQSDAEMLAADSSETSRTIEVPGFTVQVHKTASRGRWMVGLILHPDARSSAPTGFDVRLMDSGGQVWLQGPIGPSGGLDGYWEVEGETPIQRLRTHILSLDFC